MLKHTCVSTELFFFLT